MSDFFPGFARRRIEGEAFAEYPRCFENPDTIRAICADYRAGAAIDLEHDRADRGGRIAPPLLVLWGEKSAQGSGYDVLSVWRERAAKARGQPVKCRHCLPEEAPEETGRALRNFFAAV